MLWGAEKLVPAEYWCPYGNYNPETLRIIRVHTIQSRHCYCVSTAVWLNDLLYPCLCQKLELASGRWCQKLNLASKHLKMQITECNFRTDKGCTFGVFLSQSTHYDCIKHASWKGCKTVLFEISTISPVYKIYHTLLTIEWWNVTNLYKTVGGWGTTALPSCIHLGPTNLYIKQLVGGVLKPYPTLPKLKEQWKHMLE